MSLGAHVYVPACAKPVRLKPHVLLRNEPLVVPMPPNMTALSAPLILANP